MNPKFPNMPAKFEKYGSRGGSMLIRVNADFSYVSRFGLVKVPKGFISDGASVPRPFWSIFSPFNGDYFEAALIHDYLYSKISSLCFPDLSRENADQIFMDAMYDLGVGWFSRHAIHRAVRLGGWLSYKKK
jgi:hypothetical protein